MLPSPATDITVPEVKSSVVVLGVPVYNEARHLQSCLDSIERQSFTDFAVAISDNASSDGSTEIAAAFCQRDRRFHLIRHRSNRGAASNYAHCFNFSQSPYFGFVGAHDILKADYLATHVSALNMSPGAALSFSAYEFIDEAGLPRGHVPSRMMPGPTPQDYCPWKRVLWSVRSHAVGSGLFGGVFVRSRMPAPPYPAVVATDHLFITKVLFNGAAIEQPHRLYQERHFRTRTSGYMERITASKRSKPNLVALYREYMHWYDALPDCPEKTSHRTSFQKAVVRKCLLSTKAWGYVNLVRGRLGLGEPIR